MPISATNLNKAYLAYFGRPADATGQAYFATLEQADVIKAFDASAESQALYGSDVAAKINAIYKNLFNRDAEPAGLTYWLGQVSSGKVTPAGAAFAILEGAQGTDKTSVDNKLAASEAFIKEMDTTAEIIGYSGLNAVNSARAFLATVGADAATLTAAVAGAQAAVAAATVAGSNEAGATTVLTTGQDILVGTAGADTFRAVAGLALGFQDQTTLNSSDIIDGAGGMDKLIVNMTGPNYLGGARIKNIETLQIGTNQAAAAFDYNVNQGANEITDVTKIVYDQINTGETLTVNNVLKTNGTLPMVAWYNDSANSTAGVAAVNYRAAQVSGTTDAQAVEFNNVAAGAANAQLNVGAGIETMTLGTMAGSSAITLNTSGNADTGVFAAAADIISSGSLTKVEMIGASAFGKAAGIVAATGLQDRVVASDLGITAATTASNLLSVGARVTTVDASKLTADSNVRFAAKNDNSDSNVTFLGGEANDYVEFERGAVNADGGKGADTFAFVTQAAGITNSGFGSTDTIKGGEGSDTAQVGLNGVGTYTLNTTEFNNKTGLEVLDVRGQNNDITVSSEVVAAADVGKFTIRTDKMVQSAAGTADQTGGSTAESTSTSVINLTALNQNQGVSVVGGSGSERVVVNNASLNAATEIDGGTNGGVAGRYDTLTILNTTVADNGDLANVKGIESMLLAETVTGNSRFDIQLTEAFLLNNTAAANAVGTTIDDTVFRIGSAASSTGTALLAGDIVSIDISGLLNATRTALSTNLTGRGIDVNFAAGVTVAYVVDGVAATAGQIALVTKADAARADAGVSSAAGVVIVPGLALTSTIAGLGTVVGGAGIDTLTMTDAGAVAIPAGASAVENLVLASTAANTAVSFVAGNSIANVTGGTQADTVNAANLAAGVNIALGDGVDALTLGAVSYTGALNGGNGVDTLTLVTGSNIAGATVTGFETLTAVGANTMTGDQYNAFTTVNSNNGASTDVLTLTTAGSFTIAGSAAANAAGFESIVLANGTNNLTLTGATIAAIATSTVAGGTGTDTLTIGADLGAGGATAMTNKTGFENLVFTVAQTTGAVTIFNQAGLNVTAQAGGIVTLGTLGQNLTVTAGASTVAGGSGVDTITLGTGADRVASAGSLFGQAGGIDTVTNFKAAGADVFGTGVNATTLNNLTVATADLTTLGGAIQTAATAAGAGLAANTQAYIVTVAAGAAAGTYAFQNIGGTVGTVDATDFIVKLVGAAAIVAGDFVV